jgi:hypothetical protein
VVKNILEIHVVHVVIKIQQKDLHHVSNTPLVRVVKNNVRKVKVHILLRRGVGMGVGPSNGEKLRHNS